MYTQKGTLVPFLLRSFCQFIQRSCSLKRCRLMNGDVNPKSTVYRNCPTNEEDSIAICLRNALDLGRQERRISFDSV